MTLIQSISGIRGTIGGKPGDGLSPQGVVGFSSAYGSWLKVRHPGKRLTVVVGRDGRISGPMVSQLAISTLQALGIDVIDLGLSTTPTVEMGVIHHNAHGGIIVTASHNPKNWNALKLLNELGEFMSASDGDEMQKFMDADQLDFSPVDHLGKYTLDETMLEVHIQKILDLPLVDEEAIRAAHFTIAVDGINSSGGIAIPLLLNALGVKKVLEINCNPDGHFRHNPEPLPEHLQALSDMVVAENAHLGLAVDPDVDRLAIVSEDGEMFGEEYTLVAVADYILSHEVGNTVSNLSSTQALADVTRARGGEHFFAPVGEVNVVEAMKKYNAIIGGEGNGGVIYPALHYGRDALVGVALFLSQLARSGQRCSRLRKQFPSYSISKNKIEMAQDVDLNGIIEAMAEKYSKQPMDRRDGLKIWFDKEWVHLRLSNTEPIIRLYAESSGMATADHIAEKIKQDISEFLRSL